MVHSIPEVLKAFAAGEIVVVTDDDNREGEGDLIVAASLCTAEKMAFIVRHTSGIVCAPVTSEDARRLRLDPMVAHNDSNYSTAFTVSIDYKPGMTASNLYSRYKMFGDDPWVSGPEDSGFSAWTYAEARCEIICAGSDLKDV